MSLTKRTKKALLKDEREAVKKYKKLGFPKLAADEARHADFISKQKVKKKK